MPLPPLGRAGVHSKPKAAAGLRPRAAAREAQGSAAAQEKRIADLVKEVEALRLAREADHRER